MLQIIANLPAAGSTQGIVSIHSLTSKWGIKKRVVLGLMQKYGLTTNQVGVVLHITSEYESVRGIIAGLVQTHQEMATVEKIMDINR